MPERRIETIWEFCRALEELGGIRVNPSTVKHHLREWCLEGVLDGPPCEKLWSARSPRRRRARRRSRG